MWWDNKSSSVRQLEKLQDMWGLKGKENGKPWLHFQVINND